MIVVMKFARLIAILLSLFALTGSVPAQTSDGKKSPRPPKPLKRQRRRTRHHWWISIASANPN
jgi:hypothetical protein